MSMSKNCAVTGLPKIKSLPYFGETQPVDKVPKGTRSAGFFIELFIDPEITFEVEAC